MSTRAEWPGGGTCSICGASDWHAHWQGETALRVCRTCATRVLPALIGDAVYGAGIRGSADAALTEVTGAYWRAIALAALRDRRRP